jgi:putative aldouronate transport system permease protein
MEAIGNKYRPSRKRTGLNSNSSSRRVFLAINHVFLGLVAMLVLVPLINVFSMSLSSNSAVVAGEVILWPVGFTLGPYRYIMGNPAFLNSILIAVERSVLGILIGLVCTIFVAYPISREKSSFRSRGFFVWFFLITMIFNGGLIPWFMVVKYTGLYNTIWSLVIPGAVNMFYILLLTNFIRTIPKEMEEAAFIDGAGHFRMLAQVLLPVSKPVIATLTLFLFVSHWNSWFDAFIFIAKQSNYPLQTYLFTILVTPDISHMTPEQAASFLNMNQRSIQAAEVFIAAIPVFIIYPFLQKYFTKGIVLGSVKG